MPTPEDHVAAHRAAGRTLTVDGLETFVREDGEGEAVVLVHGVPVSSLLYRKMLPELAARGLRAVAPDLLGCGFTARPEDADYTWTGIAEHLKATIDALGIDRFHLVVHDLGGPVGFEVAAAWPERIRSLTILNTLVQVTTFRKPWTMRPFESKLLGDLWFATMIDPLFTQLMYLQGISDRAVCPPDEVLAHLRLLKHGDGGAAFLKIMKGFETTAEKQDRYVGVVTSDAYPVQGIWGERDPALPLKPLGHIVRDLIGGDRFSTVPAKHFLQETAFETLSARIADLAATA